MKKTIIALLALGGVAAAADTSVLEEAYIGFTDFSSGKAALGTMKDSITLSTEGNITTLSGVTFDTAQIADSTRDCFSITLVLDAAKIGSVREFTSLAAGYYSEAGAVGIGVNADRKLQGQWGTDGYSPDGSAYTTEALPTKGTITLTFVTGLIAEEKQGSRIYVNASTTFWSSDGLRTGDNNYNTIKFNNLNDAIMQAYVHNYSLSQTQVGTLMGEIASIPEPTTATLSLLALAGLAARRRRK
ncbi:MAG: PEP-CTERM sorting domain-containing protein [Akkermansia sp.]|nr:PEP-CTERM sorting domain-containing protein [Akkermansia sp.]